MRGMCVRQFTSIYVSICAYIHISMKIKVIVKILVKSNKQVFDMYNLWNQQAYP